ncbi:MAG: GNAT family N-acetyltransferase, partial [Flavobacteriales bacterium]|nr:GNAT family N-acetyltransferase [Flavobacteriales bacterium]
MLNWEVISWSELSRDDLYAILALRAEVFVVEQDCPYQDVDGKDVC